MTSSLSRIALIQLALALPTFAALTDGLAAYYDFESDLNDKSGNGRNLITVSGTPEAAWNGGTVTRASSSITRSTLLAGKALNLVDADADALKIPVGSGASTTAAGSFNLGGNFTISAWHLLAPLPSNTSTRYFVFEGETNYDVSWGTSSGDTYKVYNGEIGGATSTLTRAAWHHVVCVFETIGDTVLETTYVDGVSIGQVSAAASTIDFSRIMLGDARTGQDRKWDGLMDEVAVWNRALTSSDLAELDARNNNGYGLKQDLTAVGKAYLNLTSAQPLLGTVSGSGLQNIGAHVQITAQPAPGYLFTGWNGEFTGRPASFDYTVATSVNATATFVKNTADSDGDGISDYDEMVIYGTDPNLADTDGDGISDYDEIKFTGTSPLQSNVDLIAQATATLGSANTGSIVVSAPSILRDPAGSGFLLQFGLEGSINHQTWTPLANPTAVILPSGSLQVTAPAPGNLQIYGILGRKP